MRLSGWPVEVVRGTLCVVCTTIVLITPGFSLKRIKTCTICSCSTPGFWARDILWRQQQRMADITTDLDPPPWSDDSRPGPAQPPDNIGPARQSLWQAYQSVEQWCWDRWKKLEGEPPPPRRATGPRPRGWQQREAREDIPHESGAPASRRPLKGARQFSHADPHTAFLDTVSVGFPASSL